MQAPIWVQKGMSFNEYASRQIIPHTRKERIEAMTSLRQTRDEWKAYLAEMQRAAQLEQLKRMLGVNVFTPSDVDVEAVDADGVPVN